MNRKRAQKAKYALAVYRGAIKEVYEIDKWQPASRESSEFWVAKLRNQGRIINPIQLEGRCEFIGKVAPDEIRTKYVARELPVRHSRNPILYFNC